MGAVRGGRGSLVPTWVMPVLAVLGLVACGGSTSSEPAGTQATQRILAVSAAASLTGPFDQLADLFQIANPGVSVRLNYGGSTDLATQILQGARVDVFATANGSTMDLVTRAGLVDGAPKPFVTNKLQIVVAKNNPKGVTSFADLVKPGTTVVVETPQEPAGAATRKVEQATGVTLRPVSEELDVKLVLSKVATGNADAGVVYVTDVRAANGKVQGVDFPEATEAINTYPIAVLRDSAQLDLARKFVALVRGPTGQRVLSNAGFGRP